MSAQIDLDGRREPAQRVTVAFADEKSSLGEIILSRDGLHGRVRQPAVERADGCRIAAEQLIGERIDLINRQLHCHASVTPGRTS